jgi:hypothetical protein
MTNEGHYVARGGLQVAARLAEFIERYALPGTVSIPTSFGGFRCDLCRVRTA